MQAVVPVCLNSILFRVEGMMARLHTALGNESKAAEYEAKQKARGLVSGNREEWLRGEE